MKDYNIEIHELVATIGRELIHSYNENYIKNFFKSPDYIRLKLNCKYKNCDLRLLDQYFYLACSNYNLRQQYPAYLKYSKNIVDRKEHCIMQLNKNNQGNVISLSFFIDSKNEISFDIFEAELSYYTDRASNWYKFYGINGFKLNNNSLKFSEFEKYFNEFKDEFKDKLNLVIKEINKAKINHIKYLQNLEQDKIKARENELRSFLK